MHWLIRVLIITVLALAGFQPARSAMPVMAAETAVMQDRHHHEGMTMPAMVQVDQDQPGQSSDRHPCGQKMALCCFHAPAIGAEASDQAMNAAVAFVALRPAAASPLSGQIIAPQLGPPRNSLS